MTTEPKKATARVWTTGYPKADGYYFFRWQGQLIVYTVALGGRIYLGMTEQHPPLDGEWLGPISPNDHDSLLARVERLERALRASTHALEGYRHGNVSHDLAEEVIAFNNAALEEGECPIIDKL